jgi:uncharacterized protein
MTTAQTPLAHAAEFVVDLNRFCDTADSRQAHTAATQMRHVFDFVQGQLAAVSWQAAGSRKAVKGAQFDASIESHERFLHIQASTQVSLTCGRCLNLMQLPLQVNANLQVFQSEQAADDAAMTPDADQLPDPIVASRQFDLLAQVQEELLLNLPDNPQHEAGDAQCQLPAQLDNSTASPFAALRGKFA